MKKESLKSHLSRSRLREMAGEKVYPRGEEYYQKKRVRVIYYTPDEAAGEVAGSNTYRVEFKIVKGKFKADCTCPAMNDHGFCKHATAFGLVLADTKYPTHKTIPKDQLPEKDPFAELYPNIAGWVKDGCIEIGRTDYSTSLIRVTDEGGMVWEGGTRYKTLGRVLEEADAAIAKWMGEN